MPKFSRTRLTKPVTLKKDEWVSLTWDTVSAGDAGKKGNWYINLKNGGPFTATLTAVVSTPSGQIRTRMEERNKNSKGDWVVTETYPNIEHAVTSGDTYIGDSRTQNANKDTRLLVQVNLSDGGTIKSADFSALYF